MFDKKPSDKVVPLEEVICISYTKNESQSNGDQKAFTESYESERSIKVLHDLYLPQCSFWSWEMLIHQIFQMSMYFIKGLPRIVLAIYGTTFGHSTPTERDVLNLLFNSSMIFFVKQSRLDEFKYILDCDFDSENSKKLPGLQIKSIKLTFEMPKGRAAIEDAKITEFLIDNVGTSDPQRMMGSLIYFIYAFVHPKIHSCSAPLLMKIKSESIQELKPSMHGTRALNKTLYSSMFSPLNPLMPFHFPISKECSLNTSTNFKGLHYTGAFLFKETPYCQFLLKARSSCFKHLQETGLCGVFCDYFFLHTVLHSLEHNVPGKFSAFKTSLWIDESWSWWKCYRSELFRLTVATPTINPFWTNLFNSFPTNTVYGKIYSDMVKINKEWADMMVASVLY